MECIPERNANKITIRRRKEEIIVRTIKELRCSS
jgi:hypothetical protein